MFAYAHTILKNLTLSKYLNFTCIKRKYNGVVGVRFKKNIVA